MIYIQLFLSFVQIGLFSVGGGYAAIPLIQSQVVETHEWLTMNEFTNLITIAEMTPGPIGVNSATFTGLQIAGIPGAIALLLSARFFLPVFWYLFWHLYIVNTKKLQQSVIFFPVCGLPLWHSLLPPDFPCFRRLSFLGRLYTFPQ